MFAILRFDFDLLLYWICKNVGCCSEVPAKTSSLQAGRALMSPTYLTTSLLESHRVPQWGWVPTCPECVSSR